VLFLFCPFQITGNVLIYKGFLFFAQK